MMPLAERSSLPNPLAVVKPIVFLLAATPILILAHDAIYGVIAANPYPTLVSMPSCT